MEKDNKNDKDPKKEKEPEEKPAKSEELPESELEKANGGTLGFGGGTGTNAGAIAGSTNGVQAVPGIGVQVTTPSSTSSTNAPAVKQVFTGYDAMPKKHTCTMAYRTGYISE